MKTGKRQVLIMTAFSAMRFESATNAEPSDFSNWSQGLDRAIADEMTSARTCMRLPVTTRWLCRH
jgi:hypothetical protein